MRADVIQTPVDSPGAEDCSKISDTFFINANFEQGLWRKNLNTCINQRVLSYESQYLQPHYVNQNNWLDCSFFLSCPFNTYGQLFKKASLIVSRRQIIHNQIPLYQIATIQSFWNFSPTRSCSLDLKCKIQIRGIIEKFSTEL